MKKVLETKKIDNKYSDIKKAVNDSLKDLKTFVSEIDDELFELAVQTYSKEFEDKGDFKLLAFHLPFSRTLDIKTCEENIKKIMQKVKANYRKLIIKVSKFRRTE